MNFPEPYRVSRGHQHPQFNLYHLITQPGVNGAFLLPKKGKPGSKYFLCIASNGMGWDHVSVSIPGESRCPTWEEMCYIKDQFFNKNEVVIQYHPAEKDYVNDHEFCLHLWRPLAQPLPVPDSIFVGRKIK